MQYVYAYLTFNLCNWYTNTYISLQHISTTDVNHLIFKQYIYIFSRWVTSLVIVHFYLCLHTESPVSCQNLTDFDSVKTVIFVDENEESTFLRMILFMVSPDFILPIIFCFSNT